MARDPYLYSSYSWSGTRTHGYGYTVHGYTIWTHFFHSYVIDGKTFIPAKNALLFLGCANRQKNVGWGTFDKFLQTNGLNPDHHFDKAGNIRRRKGISTIAFCHLLFGGRNFQDMPCHLDSELSKTINERIQVLIGLCMESLATIPMHPLEIHERPRATGKEEQFTDTDAEEQTCDGDGDIDAEEPLHADDRDMNIEEQSDVGGNIQDEEQTHAESNIEQMASRRQLINLVKPHTCIYCSRHFHDTHRYINHLNCHKKRIRLYWQTCSTRTRVPISVPVHTASDPYPYSCPILTSALFDPYSWTGTRTHGLGPGPVFMARDPYLYSSYSWAGTRTNGYGYTEPGYTIWTHFFHSYVIDGKTFIPAKNALLFLGCANRQKNVGWGTFDKFLQTNGLNPDHHFDKAGNIRRRKGISTIAFCHLLFGGRNFQDMPCHLDSELRKTINERIQVLIGLCMESLATIPMHPLEIHERPRATGKEDQ
ncbi:uncharacterized protein [Amphiura filiformis]|uniref:uncharacterized protein n=1 Tax=Amphiura filiformis TaxID=82378 RepID=UPI003B20ED53